MRMFQPHCAYLLTRLRADEPGDGAEVVGVGAVQNPEEGFLGTAPLDWSLPVISRFPGVPHLDGSLAPGIPLCKRDAGHLRARGYTERTILHAVISHRDRAPCVSRVQNGETRLGLRHPYA